MDVYPSKSRRFSEGTQLRDLEIVHPAAPQTTDDSPLSLATPLLSAGIGTDDTVAVNPLERSYDQDTNSFEDGLPPGYNKPATTPGFYPLEIHRACVTEAPSGSGKDTIIKVSLYDEPGIVNDVRLLLPWDSSNSQVYEISDCVPSPEVNDDLMVMKTDDGFWYAPGPFIPKDDIKNIFACP